MQSPSYFSGIVKILETPKQKIVNNKIISTKFRVLIPQIRKNRSPKIILLVFWGNLASDIKNYYRINDYILIEGYISIKINKTTDSMIFNSKKIIITTLKIYPFLLKSNNTIHKI